MRKGSPSTRAKKSEEAIDSLPNAEHIEGTQILDPVASGPEENEEGLPPGGRSAALAKSDRPTSRFERIESVFRMVSLVAITASVMLTAFQFYKVGVDGRKERSVALMSSWQGSDEREAFARISAALEERLESLSEIRGQVTPAAMKELKFLIGEALIEDWATAENYDDWAADVDSIFNFYSEVEFCIRAELCDEALLKSYFGDEAVSFWEYFRGFAEDRRESFYPDYGVALEQFVIAFGD
jgi:hypothetical protein